MMNESRLYPVKWGALCLLLTACADQAVVPPDGLGRDTAIVSAIGAVQDHIPGEIVAAAFTSVSEKARADRVAAAVGFARHDRDQILRCEIESRSCWLEGADAFVTVEQTLFDDEVASIVIAIIGQHGSGPGAHLDETSYRVDLKLIDGAWRTTGEPQLVLHLKLN